MGSSQALGSLRVQELAKLPNAYAEFAILGDF